MFIDQTQKLLFMHSPKTCGTTVKAILDKYMRNENTYSAIGILDHMVKGDLFNNIYYHYNAKQTAELFPDYHKCYTFATVRNPYDRIYSLHTYIGYEVRKNMGIVAVLILITIAIPLLFVLVVLCVIVFILHNFQLLSYGLSPFPESCCMLKDLQKTHFNIFASQTAWTNGIRIDKVIYEDNFESEFRKILERFDCIPKDVEIPKLRVSSSNKKSRYTDDAIRCVNEVYADDFEQFKFDLKNKHMY